ncbi:hypothetical protein QTP88_001564 [Uroleucon formosanum]
MLQLHVVVITFSIYKYDIRFVHTATASVLVRASAVLPISTNLILLNSLRRHEHNFFHSFEKTTIIRYYFIHIDSYSIKVKKILMNRVNVDVHTLISIIYDRDCIKIFLEVTIVDFHMSVRVLWNMDGAVLQQQGDMKSIGKSPYPDLSTNK